MDTYSIIPLSFKRYHQLTSKQQKRSDMSNEIIIEKVEVLTEKDAARYIGMSRSFLSADRINGYRDGRTKGPAFMKLGRSVRYRRDDLDRWLMQNRVTR